MQNINANRVNYDGDPQGLFNDVVSHLRRQNAVCMNEMGTYCKYRNIRGLKCAIGGILPDELYEEMYDANPYSVSMLYDVEPLKQFFGPDNEKLAKRLQLIHDKCDIENWEKEFQRVADEFELTLQLEKKE